MTTKENKNIITKRNINIKIKLKQKIYWLFQRAGENLVIY